MKVYQPVAHIQGNSMSDPGTVRHGPLFFTRYQAKKWAEMNWYTVNYVTVESVSVFKKASCEE
jgi:hypothetical protein